MQILLHIGLIYFLLKKEVIYFGSFWVEHVPKDIEKFIEDKKIKINIFRTYFEWKHFCIGFIDCLLAGKTLTDYTSLVFAYDFKRIIVSF